MPRHHRGATHMIRSTTVSALALTAVAALALSGCATPGGAASEPEAADAAADVAEFDVPQPRLAVTHDDGVVVLDAVTLEVVAEIPTDATPRAVAAEDGRHAFLTDPEGVSVLDLGVWSDAHGDHGHSYATDPALTDLRFEVAEPSHVVEHGGVTALFGDGDGEVVLLDTSDLADGVDELRRIGLRAPHHGVALQLEDGTVLTTDGDDSANDSVVATDADGEELARTDDCTGIHGETIAAGETVAFGCIGAVTTYADGAFDRIALPDADGRVGGPKGDADSPVLFADYSRESEKGRDTVALIDVESGTVELLELPTGYSYGSLARDGEDRGVVLGLDGALHVVDLAAGAVTASIPAIEAWAAPEGHGTPTPGVVVHDGVAYVTEPAANRVTAVDLDTASILAEAELEMAPRQAAVVSG